MCTKGVVNKKFGFLQFVGSYLFAQKILEKICKVFAILVSVGHTSYLRAENEKIFKP